MNPSVEVLLGFDGPGTGVPLGRMARGHNTVLVSDPASVETSQNIVAGCRTVMRSR
jgi:hypothetical protein